MTRKPWLHNDGQGLQADLTYQSLSPGLLKKNLAKSSEELVGFDTLLHHSEGRLLLFLCSSGSYKTPTVLFMLATETLTKADKLFCLQTTGAHLQRLGERAKVLCGVSGALGNKLAESLFFSGCC
jgi:hypothetical protein